MLDAFIIEQLQDERRRRRWEPIPLELPLPPSEWPDTREHNESERRDDDRGVVIIDPDGTTSTL